MLKMGFPGGSVGKESTCKAEEQEMWVQSLSWEDPWRRAWQHTPVFLPGESLRQRNLAGTVHRFAKSQTRLK